MVDENTDGFLDRNLWKGIIVDHILEDIRWAIDSKRELVAAQLLLAAIDVAAGIDRPEEQEETTGNNFIAWCDRHMSLKGRNYTLTGLDLWGARCGFLHGYTPQSKVVRQSKARMLAYIDEASEVVMADNPQNGLVIVSLKALFQSLCVGLIASMKSANGNAEVASIVNGRLKMMFHSVPLPEDLRSL